MDLISRVADHCLWFGRYVERAESTARVLFVTNNLALDGELSAAQCWLPVLIVAGERERFEEKHGEAATSESEIVQRYMTWDDDNFVSIRRSVSAARDNARSIREVLSLEVWEATNELHLWLGSDAARQQYEHNRYEVYRKIRHLTQLCLGLLRSTMLHDTPLDFIWLGVLLERVGQTARILDVHHHAFATLPLEGSPAARASHHQVVETALWLLLLRACSGFEPFMKQRQGRVNANAVAGFLMLEPRFPRSVRYCVQSAYERLCAIRPPGDDAPGGQTLERLRVLHEWLLEMRVETLDPATVHDALTHVVDETAGICDGLGRELFGHGPPMPTAVAAPQARVQRETQTQAQKQKQFSALHSSASARRDT